MKNSVLFWFYCIISGPVLSLLPILGTYFWIRFIVWFSLLQYMKLTNLFFKHVPWEMRFEKKETVVITGSSSGIGAETARQLAAKGGKVIWAARSTNKAQEILDDIRWSVHHGPRGYVLPLDLADMESIRNFAEEFKRREKKLDCLILNAASPVGPKIKTKDGFEQNFGVNHLGHMYLVYLLMDILKENAPSRIVVVSSDLHRMCREVRFHDLMFDEPNSYTWMGWTAYNHSKLCNMLFVREMGKRLHGSGVTIHAAHPGTPIQTELMRSNFLGHPVVSHVIVRPLAYTFLRQPLHGAQTLIYCACADECQKTNGKYFENVERVQPSKPAQNDDAAQRLWEVSCQLLKIDNNWLVPVD